MIAGAGANATRALVLSQVVLSFGIPQALVPLAWLTGKRDMMGEFRNPLPIALPVWGHVLLIGALNVFLLARVLGR